MNEFISPAIHKISHMILMYLQYFQVFFIKKSFSASVQLSFKDTVITTYMINIFPSNILLLTLLFISISNGDHSILNQFFQSFDFRYHQRSKIEHINLFCTYLCSFCHLLFKSRFNCSIFLHIQFIGICSFFQFNCCLQISFKKCQMSHIQSDPRLLKSLLTESLG